ncbi:amino acid adenylation domain-containing protein [Spirillospora sp. NPDC046719]
MTSGEFSSAARRELVERLLRGAGDPAIGPRAPGAPVPLLPAQRRVWLADRLLGRGPGYHVYIAAELVGDLDVEVLRRALADLAGRHQALRTSFAVEDGEVRQIVAARGAVPLEVSAASDLGAQLREAARRTFPDGVPPIRAELFTGGRTHLILVAHHLLADGWSLRLLVADLSALYRAHRLGLAPPPVPAAIGAADAACALARPPGPSPEGLRFWTERLALPLPVLDLPADRPRPPVATGNGALLRLTLDRGLCAALRRLGEGTAFSALLAGFAATLQRWTEQDDLVIGVPVSGRDRAELQSVVGLFAQTLPLRIGLAGHEGLRALAARVRRQFLTAHRYSDVPFDAIVRALALPRDAARNPVYQASFVMEDEPVELDRLDGLRTVPAPLHNGTAKFDVTLYATERGGPIELSLEYATDVFGEETARRLLETCRDLLTAAAAAPDVPLPRVPLPPGPPLAGPVRARPDHGAHRLVAATGGTALLGTGRPIGYGELDQRSLRLATRLRHRGVGRGTVVAIRLDRGPELVVAALAVWRAGGAFLGVDPDHPPERTRRMLEHAGVRLVITPGVLADLEREGPATGGPDADVRGADLAYVVRTSGSSGPPKGVMATHAGVVNYLSYVVEQYGLGADDVVLQLPSFAFDSAIRDTFAPLAAGATLVLTHSRTSADPASILDALARHRVTCLLSVVPTLLTELARAAGGHWARDHSALRLVLVSGEPLRWADLRRARSALGPGAVFVNQYGPTETTMTATFRPVAPGEDGIGDVPAGRLIPNLDGVILDRFLRPVPPGVPGELYLGGTGVARGYLGDSATSASRFVAGPDGALRYRTGDRVRVLPDGEIAFLRRTDALLKRHGVRVDPGEVEEALRSVPGVHDAAVTADGAELAAYLTGAGALDAAALRAHLRALLPGPMIPSSYHQLPALPRTPNGKVDRAALTPSPDSALSRPPGRPPATALERTIAGLWAEALGSAAPVPADVDFFALGGDSLAAIVLAERLTEHLGVRVAPADLLASATVAALAEGRGLADGARHAVPLRDGEGAPLVLIHPLSGDLLCYRHLLAGLPPSRTVLGFQSHGAPPGTVAELAGRYAREARRRHPQGPLDLAGWSFGGLIAVEMARLLGGARGGVRTLALLDTSPRDETEDLTEAEARAILAATSPGPVPESLVESLLANARARRGYRFRGPRLDIDLVLVQATQDHPVLPARRMDEPELWRARTTGSVRVLSLPTSHYGLLDTDHVSAIARILEPVADRGARKAG